MTNNANVNRWSEAIAGGAGDAHSLDAVASRESMHLSSTVGAVSELLDTFGAGSAFLKHSWCDLVLSWLVFSGLVFSLTRGAEVSCFRLG